VTHHVPAKCIFVPTIKRSLREGKIKEAFTHEEIGCPTKWLSIGNGDVIPLSVLRQKTCGRTENVFTDKNQLT